MRTLMGLSQWTPCWRPKAPPALSSSHIIAVDASQHGYGFIYRPPTTGDQPQKILTCSRKWPAQSSYYAPTLATLDEQFHREVWGLHLTLQELFGDMAQYFSASVFLITDVSGICRSIQRRYTSSPLLMDIIVDLERQTQLHNITFTCSWGPGGDAHPADALSRALHHSTKWVSHTDPSITDFDDYCGSSYNWFMKEFQAEPL